MKTRIEASQTTYHGLHKSGGWNYTRRELGAVTLDGDLSMDAAELAARRHFPSATWFRVFEILPDHREHWVFAGSL